MQEPPAVWRQMEGYQGKQQRGNLSLLSPSASPPPFCVSLVFFENNPCPDTCVSLRVCGSLPPSVRLPELLASPAQPPGELTSCDGPSFAKVRKLSQARPAAGQRQHSQGLRPTGHPPLCMGTLLNWGRGAGACAPTCRGRPVEVSVPRAATFCL